MCLQRPTITPIKSSFHREKKEIVRDIKVSKKHYVKGDTAFSDERKTKKRAAILKKYDLE
jgi:hypothetical protein